MLRTTRPVKNTSVGNLVQFWAGRYVPDLSTLYSAEGQLPVSELVEVTSKEGRTKTVAKLQRLLQLDCESAGIKTNALFSYIPNVVNLTEARQIARFAGRVYEKALEIYLQQSPTPALLAAMPLATALSPFVGIDVSREWAMPALELPAIEELAIALEPVLKQLREQHLSTSNRRTFGFITTQFHLSTKLLLMHLTLPEQVLLSPYFKFVEEQVCIPWQRVCAAAAKHHLESPTLAVVQQLLPASHDIASTVYRRAAKLYPAHRSRRGALSDSGVMASTIRDLVMFQGYLWLCVLERSMVAVEQELLPLCVMVFPSVDVTWELVRQMLKLLIDELQVRVEPSQAYLFQPYTQAMQQLFRDLETKSA